MRIRQHLRRSKSPIFSRFVEANESLLGAIKTRDAKKVEEAAFHHTQVEVDVASSLGLVD